MRGLLAILFVCFSGAAVAEHGSDDGDSGSSSAGGAGTPVVQVRSSETALRPRAPIQVSLGFVDLPKLSLSRPNGPATPKLSPLPPQDIAGPLAVMGMAKPAPTNATSGGGGGGGDKASPSAGSSPSPTPSNPQDRLLQSVSNR